MNYKVSIFLTLLFLLTGCVKEETKIYYMNIEGYITHTETKKVTETVSSRYFLDSRPRTTTHTTTYLIIHVNGKIYEIVYSDLNESLLKIGNKINFKVNETSSLIYDYEILEDDNTRMREQLLKESKELESVEN